MLTALASGPRRTGSRDASRTAAGSYWTRRLERPHIPGMFLASFVYLDPIPPTPLDTPGREKRHDTIEVHLFLAIAFSE